MNRCTCPPDPGDPAWPCPRCVRRIDDAEQDRDNPGDWWEAA